jgi:hypothetical protein
MSVEEWQDDDGIVPEAPSPPRDLDEQLFAVGAENQQRRQMPSADVIVEAPPDVAWQAAQSPTGYQPTVATRPPEPGRAEVTSEDMGLPAEPEAPELAAGESDGGAQDPPDRNLGGAEGDDHSDEPFDRDAEGQPEDIPLEVPAAETEFDDESYDTKKLYDLSAEALTKTAWPFSDAFRCRVGIHTETVQLSSYHTGQSRGHEGPPSQAQDAELLKNGRGIVTAKFEPLPIQADETAEAKEPGTSPIPQIIITIAAPTELSVDHHATDLAALADVSVNDYYDRLEGLYRVSGNLPTPEEMHWSLTNRPPETPPGTKWYLNPQEQTVAFDKPVAFVSAYYKQGEGESTTEVIHDGPEHAEHRERLHDLQHVLQARVDRQRDDEAVAAHYDQWIRDQAQKILAEQPSQPNSAEDLVQEGHLVVMALHQLHNEAAEGSFTDIPVRAVTRRQVTRSMRRLAGANTGVEAFSLRPVPDTEAATSFDQLKDSAATGVETVFFTALTGETPPQDIDGPMAIRQLRAGIHAYLNPPRVELKEARERNFRFLLRGVGAYGEGGPETWVEIARAEGTTPFRAQQLYGSAIFHIRQFLSAYSMERYQE